MKKEKKITVYDYKKRGLFSYSGKLKNLYSPCHNNLNLNQRIMIEFMHDRLNFPLGSVLIVTKEYLSTN
tara:strand:+ start:575 stop:781 length:207 start_codon:yes stop_codon:yes gene_type:complete